MGAEHPATRRTIAASKIPLFSSTTITEYLGSYIVDAQVADRTSVVTELGEKPVLVGASMGGMTSLIGQGENPDLARGLVLVDIAPKVETAGTAGIMAFMRSGLEGFASLDEAAAAIAAYTPNRVRKPNPQGLRKNLRQRDGRWFWHWDPKFLRQGDEPTRQADSIVRYERARKAAAAVTVPTMLVRGKESHVVSEEGAGELELIPTAKLIDVTGAGHMVAGDDNDVFSGGLTGFLDDDVVASRHLRRRDPRTQPAMVQLGSASVSVASANRIRSETGRCPTECPRSLPVRAVYQVLDVSAKLLSALSVSEDRIACEVLVFNNLTE